MLFSIISFISSGNLIVVPLALSVLLSFQYFIIFKDFDASQLFTVIIPSLSEIQGISPTLSHQIFSRLSSFNSFVKSSKLLTQLFIFVTSTFHSITLTVLVVQFFLNQNIVHLTAAIVSVV
jgi:hypothetical protein